MTEKELNTWFNNLDFRELEIVTRYRQLYFDLENGYQEFVDACENWWNELSQKEKKAIYDEYNE